MHAAALLAANNSNGSHFDYCNSLFRCLSALVLCMPHCVQNSLERIVANAAKYSHITPVKKSLYCLPIKHRTVLKTVLFVYKFLQSGYPQNFASLLKAKQRVYKTCRSQSYGVLLEVPHFA